MHNVKYVVLLTISEKLKYTKDVNVICHCLVLHDVLFSTSAPCLVLLSSTNALCFALCDTLDYSVLCSKVY